jgi:hypothetical protein
MFIRNPSFAQEQEWLELNYTTTYRGMQEIFLKKCFEKKY